MEVTVGPAGHREVRALTALHHRAALHAFAHIFPADAPTPSFEDDLARWEHWLDPDSGRGRRSYVARTALGSIVGVVLAGPDPDDSDVGHLSRLYVDPDHWTMGIGTELYNVAMEDLRSRFGVAALWVLEDNTRARSWYERLGWRITPRRAPTYAPAGIYDVQYRIELTQ